MEYDKGITSTRLSDALRLAFVYRIIKKNQIVYKLVCQSTF